MGRPICAMLMVGMLLAAPALCHAGALPCCCEPAGEDPCAAVEAGERADSCCAPCEDECASCAGVCDAKSTSATRSDLADDEPAMPAITCITSDQRPGLLRSASSCEAVVHQRLHLPFPVSDVPLLI